MNNKKSTILGIILIIFQILSCIGIFIENNILYNNVFYYIGFFCFGIIGIILIIISILKDKFRNTSSSLTTSIFNTDEPINCENKQILGFSKTIIKYYCQAENIIFISSINNLISAIKEHLTYPYKIPKLNSKLEFEVFCHKLIIDSIIDLFTTNQIFKKNKKGNYDSYINIDSFFKIFKGCIDWLTTNNSLNEEKIILYKEASISIFDSNAFLAKES